VVRRLRSAIVLGLLSDGDKLPREADLAKELGVSNFSLREALSVLRSDGLIVTRPGKNGGSFVRRPRQPVSLAHAELVRLSSAELRDLGEWRQMLTGTAAAMAAQRAAASNLDRLDGYAEQLARAGDGDQARRVYARYHLELAAAAQSTRLSHAELTMHEEFDWLIGLVLDDRDRREQAARALRDLTGAVRRKQPKAARAAAEQQASSVMHELARWRLVALAAQNPTGPTGPTGTGAESDEFATEIRGFVDHILGQLAGIAKDAQEPLAHCESESALRRRVARSVFAQVEDLEPVVHGLGVIAEAGVVPEHPYWIEWWLQTDTGGLDHDTCHVMDPARDDFYDYMPREFIAKPRENLTPWAVGPYVDNGGVGDYLLTVSVPIVHEDRFLGVAAIDVLAATLERRFAPRLARVQGPCLLLNADDRVIVSSALPYSVGDVLSDRTGFRTRRLGIFGWSLATEDSPDAT
jgi:DNA-binding FadR family transcriptional regulator